MDSDKTGNKPETPKKSKGESTKARNAKIAKGLDNLWNAMPQTFQECGNPKKKQYQTVYGAIKYIQHLNDVLHNGADEGAFDQFSKDMRKTKRPVLAADVKRMQEKREREQREKGTTSDK